MERIIATLLQQPEQGKLNRRQLIQSLTLAATAGTAAPATAATEDKVKQRDQHQPCVLPSDRLRPYPRLLRRPVRHESLRRRRQEKRPSFGTHPSRPQPPARAQSRGSHCLHHRQLGSGQGSHPSRDPAPRPESSCKATSKPACTSSTPTAWACSSEDCASNGPLNPAFLSRASILFDAQPTTPRAARPPAHPRWPGPSRM